MLRGVQVYQTCNSQNKVVVEGCQKIKWYLLRFGARCSSVVRAFAHGAMGRRIDPSWGGPIELFLIPAIAPRLDNKGCGMCYPV